MLVGLAATVMSSTALIFLEYLRQDERNTNSNANKLTRKPASTSLEKACKPFASSIIDQWSDRREA
jgi:hypothetical protein